MKNAIVILATMLPLVLGCSERTHQKTTTTTRSSYSAPAPEPAEVVEQKRTTTTTVHQYGVE